MSTLDGYKNEPTSDKQKAAAAERAKRASTSIDGTGQGANRRPALAADADLTDVIRDALNRSVDG